MKNHFRTLLVASMFAVSISPAYAQIVATRMVQSGPSLPPNTIVYVSLNADLTTKHTHQGDQFDVTTTRPVIVDGYVVIPQGTLGHGRISYRTGKGVMGKSAKMEFELTELEVGNQVVPIKGHYRLEGDGNTGATVGIVAAGALTGVGIIPALFVTGRSASAAQGTEYRAATSAPVTFALADGPSAPVQAVRRGGNSDPYQSGRQAAALALASANPNDGN